MHTLCQGKPLTQVRPLSSGEMQLLSEAWDQTQRRLVVLRVCLVMSPVLFFVMLGLAAPYKDASLATFISFLVGFPLLLVLHRDATRRGRILKVARQGSDVQVFEEGETAAIVREPTSGLVISELPSTMIVAETVEVADLPDTYMFSEELPLPTLDEVKAGERIPRRDLTPEERTELKALINRMALNETWWRILIIVYCGYVAVASVLGLDRYSLWHGLLMGFIGLLSLLSLVDAINVQRKVRQDLNRGIVLRVQVEGRRVEWLPASRMLWTENQQPAPARKSGRFRRL